MMNKIALLHEAKQQQQALRQLSSGSESLC